MILKMTLLNFLLHVPGAYELQFIFQHVQGLGLKGVLVVPVSESIWACNRLQI